MKRFICSLVLLAVSAALFLAARRVSGFADQYAATVYPALVGTVGRFFGTFPFSAAEIFLYALPIGSAISAVRGFRRPLRLLSGYLLLVGILCFLYVIGCGINYSRTPFSSYYIAQTGVTPGTSDDEMLEELTSWLTDEVIRTEAELAGGADGTRGTDSREGETDRPESGEQKVSQDRAELSREAKAAMKRLSEEYPILSGYYPDPKPVTVSWILSIQLCTGVYSPFTIEANYNRDMVSYNLPLTICHELSHLRGFMREDEANFIGYLACIGSESAEFRYSGYLLGWIYAGNALAEVNYDAYCGLYDRLSERTRKELSENSEFWNRYEGKASEIQTQVNDAYLKANGQAEGVRTYDRVVELMLLDYQRRNLSLYTQPFNGKISVLRKR